ncbi:hypothetical protein DdX_21152 [Ditylenchus destructor]|uniref:Uncharacterized protein n=1 Tax=Ditylenchus destructor TaxID=166010 RepID=A0AAD4QRI2_9BILA|nr:hypothetical protein DdX_21152 [Ditylenchus destructor]
MLLKTLFVIIILFTDGTFARTLEPAVNDKDGHAGRYKRDTTDEGVLSQLGIKQYAQRPLPRPQNTGPAHIATVVDPPQSSAVHDNMEQPMEEVDDAEVKRHYAEC